jgi:maltokinase
VRGMGEQAVAGGLSARVAHRLAPDVVAADAPERPLAVDEGYVSVVVGEAVVVKWLQPPAPAPHRAVMLMEHLAEVGFVETPPLHGADVVDGNTVAIVTGYLPESYDGWTWYVDLLTTELDGGGDIRAVGIAARLGSLAARLHHALATPTRVLPLPVEWADASAEHARGCTLLDAALSLTAGEAGVRLRQREGRIRATIDTLADFGDVDVQHIHGDLHVGQVLRSRDALLVTDFDGSPVTACPGRPGGGMRSAMVDLASLAQSVDHVGRVVAKRRPDLAYAVDEFLAEAVPTVISSYARAAAVDERLLDALRTVQELHEYVYAAMHLPRWGYVPDAAMAALHP